MANKCKPSVFATFNQLRVSEDFDSDNGSAEERDVERKEKQKQKKKSRSKKKNSDSAQLKDLAFVSVSKSKKNKSKKSTTQTALESQSPAEWSVEDAAAANGDIESIKEDSKPEKLMEGNMKSTLGSQKSSAVPNGIKKKTAPQQKHSLKKKLNQQQNIAPPTPSAVASSVAESSSETDLGVVYAPTHITITRADGQMTRTVAVEQLMDQLLRYTQQNSQLLMVQEQVGHANRTLQDQLKRSADIINGLQNEVTMFRQMCLNLQAEVSLLRSANAPALGNNSQQQHRPPPGMS